mgnify:CR=1 FL=1
MPQMDILGKLFGSPAKVKIMRLFDLNPDFTLKTEDVAKRAKISTSLAGKELGGLASVGFLHKGHKANFLFWQLDKNFPFISPLRNLLKNNLISHKKSLARQISACGRLQLLILSGIFIDNEGEEGRVDLLIVGNNMRRGAIDRLIKKFEAEIGKELNYAVLDTADFKYRLNACDKFTRDILDFPHEMVVDKIGI